MKHMNGDILSQVDPEIEARREFLKKVAKGTATVPALTLLMAANSRAAHTCSYERSGSSPGGAWPEGLGSWRHNWWEGRRRR